MLEVCLGSYNEHSYMFSWYLKNSHGGKLRDNKNNYVQSFFINCLKIVRFYFFSQKINKYICVCVCVYTHTYITKYMYNGLKDYDTLEKIFENWFIIGDNSCIKQILIFHHTHMILLSTRIIFWLWWWNYCYWKYMSSNVSKYW